MIDVLTCRRVSEVLSLSQAALLVPNGRGGRGVHVSTLARWAREGRLQVSRTPGGLMVTTEAALIRAMGLESIEPEREERQAAPSSMDLDAELDRVLGATSTRSRRRACDAPIHGRPLNARGRGREHPVSAPTPDVVAGDGGGTGRRPARRRSSNSTGAGGGA